MKKHRKSWLYGTGISAFAIALVALTACEPYKLGFPERGASPTPSTGVSSSGGTSPQGGSPSSPGQPGPGPSGPSKPGEKCTLPPLKESQDLPTAAQLAAAFKAEVDSIKGCADSELQQTINTFLSTDPAGPTLSGAQVDEVAGSITKFPFNGPQELFVAFRHLYFLAERDKSGLALDHQKAVEWSQAMLEVEDPVTRAAAFVASFKYAHAEKGGLKMSVADAKAFAEKVREKTDPVKTVDNHRKAYSYAIDPAGPKKMSDAEALAYANRLTGLSL